MTSVAVQLPHSEKLSFDQGGALMRETRRDVAASTSARSTASTSSSASSSSTPRSASTAAPASPSARSRQSSRRTPCRRSGNRSSRSTTRTPTLTRSTPSSTNTPASTTSIIRRSKHASRSKLLKRPCSMRELDRRERTGYSRHRPATKEKTDDAFLTVRKLKRGSYEDWCRAWEPDEWPEGAQKAYIPRNLWLDGRGGCHRA